MSVYEVEHEHYDGKRWSKLHCPKRQQQKLNRTKKKI